MADAAGESNGGNTLKDSLGGCTHGTRDLDGSAQVGTDVGTGNGKVRAAAEEARGDVLDAISHRGDGERVDIVESWVVLVVAIGRATSRAGVELARSVAGGWVGIGGAYIELFVRRC